MSDDDKTDGIVWQKTKPQLISRNFSTGNLQALERRVNESNLNTGSTSAAPSAFGGFSTIFERKRQRSLSSLFSTEQDKPEERQPSESFFKEFMNKYDPKGASETGQK